MTLLQTTDLHKKFGGVIAVNEVSLTLEPNEILGMIGPNGSGKSTFINLLTGIYRPDGGGIQFCDEPIGGLPPWRVMQKGIARTFQNLRIFSNIPVLSNILIGRHCRIDNSLLSIYLNPFASWRRDREAKEKAMDILEMADLADCAQEPAKNLSYGKQRLLEICRALASEPELLLLDEPCAGMNPVEMDTLADFIRLLKKRGKTIFVVEHNMRFIMSLADRLVVLDAGKKFREGTPEDIQKDKAVQKIYLGEEA